jgi:hypothetical protein
MSDRGEVSAADVWKPAYSGSRPSGSQSRGRNNLFDAVLHHNDKKKGSHHRPPNLTPRRAPAHLIHERQYVSAMIASASTATSETVKQAATA